MLKENNNNERILNQDFPFRFFCYWISQDSNEFATDLILFRDLYLKENIIISRVQNIRYWNFIN